MLKVWKNVYHKKSSNGNDSEVLNNEKEAAKDHVLANFERSIKLLLQYGVSKEVVRSDCWVVNEFCLHLDEALRHGLRRPALGYWPFVRLFTHTNNIQLLERTLSCNNSTDKGRAWLHYSLNEGSIESYILLFSSENGALHKHYQREALLRDTSKFEILLGLLASIRDLHFELRLEQSEAGVVSAVTPLPSPEDSGVALLDSDLSEPLDSLQDDQDDDTATLNELEDNRINRLLSLEMDTAGKVTDSRIVQLDEQEKTKSLEKSEKIVLRTPKKCNNDSNRHLKRVSFHEECFSQTGFSVSFISPGTAVPKKDTVKGRYSWCAGGDAPFIVYDTEPKTNSICVLQPEGEERGVPEGQEDDSLFYDQPLRTRADVLKLKRRQLLKKHNKTKKLLHWPGAKPNPQACQQLLQELELELEYNMQQDIVIQPVTAETLHIMRSNIFFNPLENIYKVFKAHGPLVQSDILPLLVVLTNEALYVLSLEGDTFDCHFSLSYKELEAILLGPSGQTVLLNSIAKQQVLLAMNDTDSANNLVAYTELAMRRAGIPPLSWRCLALDEMKMLWYSLARLVPSLQGERLIHFCLVHLQDETRQCSPLAATKEGLLMMRIGQTGAWVPAFLGLRETELWVYGDEIEREPQLVLSLARCQGCHRAPMAERPHTFEILCGRGSAPLQLAAADEYEASDWLQALLQAASGPAQKEEGELQLCGLVLTAGHLLAYNLKQQTPQLVCCTELINLTSLRIQNVASTWCVLEFDCSEAHENSGDWILYFSTQSSRARFCAQLEAVWPTLFEVPFPNMSDMSEGLLQRCRKTSLHLHSMWDPMLSLGFPSNSKSQPL